MSDGNELPRTLSTAIPAIPVPPAPAVPTATEDDARARIAALEREAREAAEAMADPAVYQDFARARPLIEKKAAAERELAALYGEWERLAGQLEAASGT